MKKIFSSVNNITFMGIMLGLTVIFTAVTALPTASASMALFIFIPTILTGIILGPAAGGLMGFLAGISTMLRAVLAPLSPVDLFFINPFVAVLPRTFIGIGSYYAYTFIYSLGKNEKTALFMAGAAGAAVNTLLVMLMLYVFYGRKLSEIIGAPFNAIFISVLTTNGILEAAVAAIFTLSAVTTYKKIKNRSI